MDFRCYVCKKQLNDLKLMIDHLKKLHKIKERKSEIKCIINSDQKCCRKFATFQSLHSHIEKCENWKRVSC